MKKYKRSNIIVLVVLAILIILINKDSFKNKIWISIESRLDYERSLKVGDDFNKIIWGDCSFQINHYKTGNDLEYIEGERKIKLLKSIENYKIYKNKLYVISKSGYVVIDENNIATIQVQSNDKNINSEKIKYIESFEKFEKDDKRVFEEIR